MAFTSPPFPPSRRPTKGKAALHWRACYWLEILPRAWMHHLWCELPPCACLGSCLVPRCTTCGVSAGLGYIPPRLGSCVVPGCTFSLGLLGDSTWRSHVARAGGGSNPESRRKHKRMLRKAHGLDQLHDTWLAMGLPCKRRELAEDW